MYLHVIQVTKRKIIKIPLHSRIENYFKDSDAEPDLLACKYLGNNETHYDNSNSAEDTALLGNLIDDVIYYIERGDQGEQAATIIQKN